MHQNTKGELLTYMQWLGWNDNGYQLIPRHSFLRQSTVFGTASMDNMIMGTGGDEAVGD